MLLIVCFKATLYLTCRKQVLLVGGDYFYKRQLLLCPRSLKDMFKAAKLI